MDQKLLKKTANNVKSSNNHTENPIEFKIDKWKKLDFDANKQTLGPKINRKIPP